MKKLAVLSDTHGNISAIESILPILKECDYVVHLGDCMTDMSPFREELGDKLVCVKGNCDAGAGDKIKMLEVEGAKLMFTHGDLFGVKSGLLSLSLYAEEYKADAVFYGHTHIYDDTKSGGILYCNPGAMNRMSVEKTFAFVTVSEGRVCTCINRSSVK